MAMITLAGYPASGKTTRAQELVEYLRTRLADPSTPPSFARLKPVLINDESLSLSKSVYDGAYTPFPPPVSTSSPHTRRVDARAEKPARATLFSAVQRHLNKDNIVIVDAMNYIKGSRYQMYCAAREMQVRTCTVRFLFFSFPSFLRC
jgi:protein KTI12